MRGFITRAAPLTAALVLVSGCSDSLGGEAAQQDFLVDVRTNVPGANKADDDYLLNAAQNVCTLGNVDQGVEILDNYSAIEAEDRVEFARIALRTACA